MTNVKNKVLADTIQSWREYESKKYVLEARNEEVAAARIAYEGMKKEEKAGLRTISDVITARNVFFRSYREMLTARTSHIVSGYVIASKIGECTAEHLKLDVKLYDPFKNYNIIKLQLIGSYNPKQ